MTRILHLPITSDAEAFVTAARASERALVQLGSPTVEHRGQLQRFVVDGIEAELGRLGAAPPGWRYEDGIEAIASDQLYRARLLGHSGLALRFETLGALADAEGQLGAEDSRTLRRLVALAEREPLQLYLSRRCAELQIIGDPEPLAAWLPPSIEPGRVAAIEYDDPGNGQREALPAISTAMLERTDAALAPPQIEAFVGIEETPVPPSVGSEALQPERETLPSPPIPPTASGSPESARDGESFMDAAGLDAAVWSSADASPAPPSAASREPLTPQPPRATEPVRIEPERIQRCMAWGNQLQGMSGPKVHGSIEKAFITTYLPLCREIAAGVAPAEAAASGRRWAEGFAQGYAAAFRQLNARPRRPLMVKDVVDVGLRWLGQHYARQCQLLLVSALRFDLGQRLNEELEQRLGLGAVCADQCVLWSALPSNADAQQLGEPGIIRRSRSEAKPASSPVIEPLRVGNRSLFKLDHVPGDLLRSGEPEGARIERLARELADVIVPWMRQQPPETLMVVFGDHGFHWQAHSAGTSAAQCGGALPEQVLVPASAWLLREPRQRPRVAPGIH